MDNVSSISLDDVLVADPGGLAGNGGPDGGGLDGGGKPLTQSGAPGIMIQDVNDIVLNDDTLTLSTADQAGKTVKATVTGAPDGYDYLKWSIDDKAANLSDKVEILPGNAAKGELVKPGTYPVIIPLREGEATVTVGNYNSNGFRYSYNGGKGNDFTATFTVQVEGLPSDGSGSVAIEFWTNKADSTLLTNIPGATLSRTGSNGVPKQALITGTTGYSAYQWSLNGIDIEGEAGTAPQYTFNSALKGDGQYTIGLKVKEGNGANAPWYSTSITITVLN
jgi:hypothetical protein